MFLLSSTHLPYRFTLLLKGNLQSYDAVFNSLKRYVWDDPATRVIFLESIQSICSETRLDKIIKSIGLTTIRNQLALSYLNYKDRGNFSFNDNLDLLDDLLEFEKLAETIAVNGYSRTFLLAFYFKMAGLDIFSNNKTIDLNIKDTFIYFKKIRMRTIKADWLFLIMLHFSHFFESDKLLTLMDDRKNFNEMISILSTEQKQKLTSNLLSYGYSIGEKDIFSND